MGGSGVRFGSLVPKQFLKMSNQEHPLFIRSIHALTTHIEINHCILVVNKSYMQNQDFKIPLEEYQKSEPSMQIDIIDGGNTRHESFINGARLVKYNESHTVLIHDANRPYISSDYGETIARQIRLLSDQRPCLIPVLPVVDSLCRIQEDGQVSAYTPRENICRVQTPQLLYAPYLEKALLKNDSNHVNADYADEGSFMLSMGVPVYTFSGDPENIKITNRHDIV